MSDNNLDSVANTQVESENNLNLLLITQAEIDAYREQLKDYPEALQALDAVEKCGGNLAEAFEKVVCDIAEKSPGLYSEIDEISRSIKSESAPGEGAIEPESLGS